MDRDEVTESAVRVDKWLWAARFYKTRSAAQQAIDGGKVRLNGDRTKPSKDLKVGDRLSLNIGLYDFHITVLKLSSQRAAAPIARLLYEEDEASRAAREEAIAKRRVTFEPAASRKGEGRPTKRDRRDLERWQEGE